MSGRKSTTASALVVAAGAVTFHAAPALAIRRPVRRFLPGLSGRGRPGTVALTFDDGPDPMYTPGILKVLDRLGWPATFFMLGERAERHPDLVRDVVDAGHEVALHGYTHEPLLHMGPARTFRDLGKGADALASLTGERPRWFRPTYGALTGTALLSCRRMRLRPVLWTSAAEDWNPSADAESMRTAVLRSLGVGGTVLFHDAQQPQVEASNGHALERALEQLHEDMKRAELRVVSLGDHLPGSP